MTAKTTPNQSTQTKASTQTTQQTPRHSAKTSRWLRWAIGIIIIVMLIMVYYWIDQSRRALQNHMAIATKQLDAQVQMQASGLQAIGNELNQQIGQFKQLQTDFRDQIHGMQQQLRRQQRQLASLSTLGRDDWLLAEAEYLIRLANQRLLVGKEIVGASDLLEAADDILNQLDDAALYPVRQALVEEIAALNATEHSNIEGLYFQLAALAKQVAQLRWLKPPSWSASHTPTKENNDDHRTIATGWRASLQSAWRKLQQAVRIQHHDSLYQPDLSPVYTHALQQSLQLLFIQAQTALLLGNQALYDASLSNIAKQLQPYDALNPDAIGRIVSRIEQLQQQTVTMAMPDISTSLRELKAFIDSEPRQSIPAGQPVTPVPENMESDDIESGEAQSDHDPVSSTAMDNSHGR